MESKREISQEHRDFLESYCKVLSRLQLDNNDESDIEFIGLIRAIIETSPLKLRLRIISGILKDIILQLEKKLTDNNKIKTLIYDLVNDVFKDVLKEKEDK